MADDITLLYLMSETEMETAEYNQQVVTPMSEACPPCSSTAFFWA